MLIDPCRSFWTACLLMACIAQVQAIDIAIIAGAAGGGAVLIIAIIIIICCCRKKRRRSEPTTFKAPAGPSESTVQANADEGLMFHNELNAPRSEQGAIETDSRQSESRRGSVNADGGVDSDEEDDEAGDLENKFGTQGSRRRRSSALSATNPHDPSARSSIASNGDDNASETNTGVFAKFRRRFSGAQNIQLQEAAQEDEERERERKRQRALEVAEKLQRRASKSAHDRDVETAPESGEERERRRQRALEVASKLRHDNDDDDYGLPRIVQISMSIAPDTIDSGAIRLWDDEQDAPTFASPALAKTGKTAAELWTKAQTQDPEKLKSNGEWKSPYSFA